MQTIHVDAGELQASPRFLHQGATGGVVVAGLDAVHLGLQAYGLSNQKCRPQNIEDVPNKSYLSTSKFWFPRES